MTDRLMYLISITLCGVASSTLDPMSQTIRDEGAPDWIAAIPLVFSLSFFIWMLYFIVRLLQTTRKAK